jgi:hypothetical protein
VMINPWCCRRSPAKKGAKNSSVTSATKRKVPPPADDSDMSVPPFHL